MVGVLAAALFMGGATSNAAESGHVGAALEAVDSIIGDAACRSNDDCRTIAIGRKACGGPASYRAWSVRRSDAVALAAAADASASAVPAGASGRASDCRLVTDPGAVCSVVAGAVEGAASGSGDALGRCVLRRGGAGRRAD